MANSFSIRGQYQSNIEQGLAKDKAAFAGLSGAVNAHLGAAAVGFGKIENAAGKLGGALGHAKNQILGAAGAIGPFAGAVGLAGLGGAIASSIGKVEDFGASLEKVTTLTGESTLAAGALLVEFQKFGLGADAVTKVVGFTEKTLGKLNETVDKAGVSKLTKLDQQFGLQLVDSTGKVVDFSTALGELATFYDSGASASTKAYVASQVFGRGYTQMIPILNEGSAGLRQAAKDAASLGLGSEATVKQLAAFHDEAHALDNQVNLLQLSIGTALLPSLVDVTKAATDFLSGNRDQIVEFFKQGAQFAGELGHAISTTVVPAFNFISGWWGKLPGPLKDLLIGGFVAQKASKWLLGSGPLDWGKSLIGSVLGRVPGAGAIAGAGVQHVWVDNMPAGGLGGPNLLGTAETAAGGLAPMSLAAVGGLGLVGGAALGGVQQITSSIAGALTTALSGNSFVGQVVQRMGPSAMGFPDVFGTLDDIKRFVTGEAPRQSVADIITAGQHAQSGSPTSLRAFGEHANVTQAGWLMGAATSGLPSGRDTDKLEGSTAAGVIKGLKAAGLLPALDQLHVDLEKQLGVLKTSKDPKEIAAAAQAMVKDVLAGAGGVTSTANMLDTLKTQRASATDPALIAVLDDAIAKVSARLDTRKFVEAQQKAADKITKSNLTNAQKIKELEGIEKTLQGKSTVAIKHVADEIDSLKPHIDAIGHIAIATDHPIGGGAKPGTSGRIEYAGPGRASGALGLTKGFTPLGYAGEAGTEAVAIIRNPKPLHGGAGGASVTLNVNVNVSGHSLASPGAVREMAQQIGPAIVLWMQRNGILARTGSPLRG